jgi:hypothetical protein
VLFAAVAAYGSSGVNKQHEPSQMVGRIEEEAHMDAVVVAIHQGWRGIAAGQRQHPKAA